ncbi:cbb3-type cytochrome oxidase assembly protein CcoS [Dokdonia sinensis]|uniref:Cbb3-type cytochrome oxidase assembly protein CcoS n=1 Tax=Dokdonia sinensis TaxID=2479847 RepID=A0A3M0GS90_9FLAO|nr:cbb3-type cytochrome oxidase assembly protein CcoS [Dokdonia sinensis]RMB64089.1 cbb3-type cytochrome oxidase assembly protein CcoS [Dokdonia sinensis]
MSIIYMLLAISVVVALIFFVAFIFSVKKGQYDDTYTPSVRMLFDDEIVKDKATDTTKIKESTLLKDQSI